MAVTPGSSIGSALEATPLDTTVAFTTDAAVPSGSRILLFIAAWLGSAANMSSVSGGGLTWVEDADSQSGAGAVAAIYSADAPDGLASSTTITATFNVAVQDKFIGGFYVEGAATGSDPGSYRGDTDLNDQGAGTGWTTGSMSCADGSLIFAANHSGYATQAANSNTATSPSVEVHDVDHVANWDHYCSEYRTISGAGAYTVAGTINRSATDHMTVGVEYLAAAAEGPIPAYLPARRVPKRLAGPAQLTNSAATKYTAPAGYRAMIRSVHVSNPTGAAVDFTLSIGTDAAGTRLYDGYPIPSDSYKRWFLQEWLEPGEIIQAFASTGSALALTIDGFERPAG